MDFASYLWTEYVRLNLGYVFPFGILAVVYRNWDRAKEYQKAQRIPPTKGRFDPNPDYWLKAPRAAIRLAWPIWRFMLIFGISAMILDALLHR